MAWKQLSFRMRKIQADIWDIASSLIDEVSLSRDDSELPVLFGNAAELLDCGMSLDDCQPENAWKLFKLVRRRSRPTESLRVRHSAAFCLDTSSVLRSPQAFFIIDPIRREMLDVGLQLLQTAILMYAIIWIQR